MSKIKTGATTARRSIGENWRKAVTIVTVIGGILMFIYYGGTKFYLESPKPAATFIGDLPVVGPWVANLESTTLWLGLNWYTISQMIMMFIMGSYVGVKWFSWRTPKEAFTKAKEKVTGTKEKVKEEVAEVKEDTDSVEDLKARIQELEDAQTVEAT